MWHIIIKNVYAALLCAEKISIALHNSVVRVVWSLADVTTLFRQSNWQQTLSVCFLDDLPKFLVTLIFLITLLLVFFFASSEKERLREWSDETWTSSSFICFNFPVHSHYYLQSFDGFRYHRRFMLLLLLLLLLLSKCYYNGVWFITMFCHFKFCSPMLLRLKEFRNNNSNTFLWG